MIEAKIPGSSLNIYQTHYDINPDAELIKVSRDEISFNISVKEAQQLVQQLQACIGEFDIEVESA